jgi:glyoxylase-like metal-dependent hydrolase (beta-lactamase superfamily II)
LRCGSITIPEPIAVRGAFTLAPRVIAHSTVLIRHPQALLLYDTGLSNDIDTYLVDQSLFFRKTLGNFQLEQSLGSHLKERGIERSDLDFALLSHLHWDHVSGIPDIPGVPLRINRVEYEAAKLGLLDAGNGLVRRLIGDNPMEFFDCAGPTYEGFRSSFDVFGDGSIVLVPLPGHTAGNTGMFINRSNGPRLFLLGDAAWVSQNYLRPTTMHPFIWSRVTSDDATARQTLIDLHYFALRHPEIPLIAMHDAELQEKFMKSERHIQAVGRNT